MAKRSEEMAVLLGRDISVTYYVCGEHEVYRPRKRCKACGHSNFIEKRSANAEPYAAYGLNEDKSCNSYACGSFREEFLQELHVKLGKTYDSDDSEQEYRHRVREVIARKLVIRQEYQHNRSYSVIAEILLLEVNVIPMIADMSFIQSVAVVRGQGSC